MHGPEGDPMSYDFDALFRPEEPLILEPVFPQPSKKKAKRNRVELELEDAPSEAASSPSASILKAPVQSSSAIHPKGSMEDLTKNFTKVDALERRIQRGKYIQDSSSLEMPDEVFPIKYHMSKGVTINLKPLCL